MSLIESETCTNKECHHRSMETVRWNQQLTDIPLGVLIDAIQHGYLSQESIDRLKSMDVKLHRDHAINLISETTSDMVRFQIGSCVHK